MEGRPTPSRARPGSASRRRPKTRRRRSRARPLPPHPRPTRRPSGRRRRLPWPRPRPAPCPRRTRRRCLWRAPARRARSRCPPPRPPPRPRWMLPQRQPRPWARYWAQAPPGSSCRWRLLPPARTMATTPSPWNATRGMNPCPTYSKATLRGKTGSWPCRWLALKLRTWWNSSSSGRRRPTRRGPRASRGWTGSSTRWGRRATLRPG